MKLSILCGKIKVYLRVNSCRPVKAGMPFRKVDSNACNGLQWFVMRIDWRWWRQWNWFTVLQDPPEPDPRLRRVRLGPSWCRHPYSWFLIIWGTWNSWCFMCIFHDLVQFQLVKRMALIEWMLSSHGATSSRRRAFLLGTTMISENFTIPKRNLNTQV